ncbi:MAG: DUF3263 domain-containing protein [Candidatus Nanopelagicales bacterium]|jgi:hypothetical protein|nr:DUF3263 domain-containing protein [Candidatus Nanopelagicales bacterium]MCU0298898.1 DUF3263 domain-containing protein [Candidatus Nanopelagicales bacterium]
MPALTDRDRAILDFEKNWYRFEGVKQAAIREQFDLSPTRYYQLLNALVDNPEALRAEPVVIRRLQRQRQSRRAAVSRSA